MDKQTLSTWGWIVITVIVAAILIAFATPLGKFVVNGIDSIISDAEDTMKQPYAVRLKTDTPEAGTIAFTSAGHSGTILKLKGEQTLTFAATVNAGYKFLGWYVGDTLISTDAVYTEGYTVSSKTTIEARFEEYLEPGLYETGTKTIKMSWDQLISDGVLNSDGKIVSGQEANLAGDLVLPNTLTSLWNNAFKNCTNLTGITIPDGITSISASAFNGCSGLASIDIPDGVTSIYTLAFNDCSGLTSVTFGENSQLTSIGDYAFQDCSGLTSIDIPDGVTSISYGAFQGCSGLTSISIPDRVTSIGNNAFNCCSSLTSIDIPDSVTSIGQYALNYCINLTSVNIPDGVTSIGNNAFQYCSGLTSVTIPDSVTSIGSYAFFGCSGLTSISIPDGVTSIGDSAFYGCSGLTSITVLSETPPTLGNNALGSTTALTEIKVPAASVDAYKSADGWSAYADKIVALDAGSDESTPSVDPETGEILDSWEQIIASVNDGTYATKYKVGDYKPLTLTSGEEVNMQIAAFDADILSGGSGNKARITWIAKELLATEHNMNSKVNGTATNEGGWEASEMRTYLQTDVWSLIPTNVQDAIVTVDKTYYDKTTDSTLVSEDKIWIPSCREVGLGEGYEDSGVIYSELFKDDGSRIKTLNGSSNYWWLRSANSSSIYSFRSVYSNGSGSSNNAYYSNGVAVGFCM